MHKPYLYLLLSLASCIAAFTSCHKINGPNVQPTSQTLLKSITLTGDVTYTDTTPAHFTHLLTTVQTR